MRKMFSGKQFSPIIKCVQSIKNLDTFASSLSIENRYRTHKSEDSEREREICILNKKVHFYRSIFRRLPPSLFCVSHSMLVFLLQFYGEGVAHTLIKTREYHNVNIYKLTFIFKRLCNYCYRLQSKENVLERNRDTFKRWKNSSLRWRRKKEKSKCTGTILCVSRKYFQLWIRAYNKSKKYDIKSKLEKHFLCCFNLRVTFVGPILIGLLKIEIINIHLKW